ncbi:MAG: bifunctional enoyl-CoA hydratase/phosphate acetyltransferase [Pseudomonadota bacterium]
MTDAFERILKQASNREPMPTAVVHPVDERSLGGALAAAEAGIIAPILVGSRQKIEAVGLDTGAVDIVDVPHSHAAAARAVELVHEGRAAALMKGALHTDEMLAEVIARETGLRTERRISHVFVMRTPAYDKPLLITDAAINVIPDLLAKRDIVQNAVDMAQALGIDAPKVAILSATEEINPKLPSTIDAAALCKMADRGQISGGLLDGPLAFDIAVSPGAVEAKRLESDVAGAADILVVPDLVAGNMLAKQLDYLGGADAFGIALGAQVPIILTSRADGIEERKMSAALARLLAGRAGL